MPPAVKSGGVTATCSGPSTRRYTTVLERVAEAHDRVQHVRRVLARHVGVPARRRRIDGADLDGALHVVDLAEREVERDLAHRVVETGLRDHLVHVEEARI